MIVYKDMSFCARKGCEIHSCPRNQANVPWEKLPEWMGVSLTDMWGKSSKCPEKEPERIDFKYEEDEDE